MFIKRLYQLLPPHLSVLEVIFHHVGIRILEHRLAGDLQVVELLRPDVPQLILRVDVLECIRAGAFDLAHQFIQFVLVGGPRIMCTWSGSTFQATTGMECTRPASAIARAMSSRPDASNTSGCPTLTP
jgi:hypothetical protein